VSGYLIKQEVDQRITALSRHLVLGYDADIDDQMIDLILLHRKLLSAISWKGYLIESSEASDN